jgi:hypothetical protein
VNLLLLLLGSCRSLAAAAAGLASLRGGGRVLGRGPAGRRADDAAVVVLLVQGDLASAITAIFLCLRIGVQRLLGGIRVHTAPEETHLDHGTPFLEEH